jgi:hypothetical protein
MTSTLKVMRAHAPFKLNVKIGQQISGFAHKHLAYILMGEIVLA